ncbi:hypothetical protein CEXT_808931 [Caerostris extrusa]|uniref:Uncharacterized protein n=1 Tax=Caerostris extrusa TaxID=172846 RepID=A0AAV4VQ29_CAEEX|nr:hypothetical protein CEXT_808931 [Caerostris extrusa]
MDSMTPISAKIAKVPKGTLDQSVGVNRLHNIMCNHHFNGVVAFPVGSKIHIQEYFKTSDLKNALKKRDLFLPRAREGWMNKQVISKRLREGNTVRK